jgi:hypothetical protein
MEIYMTASVNLNPFLNNMAVTAEDLVMQTTSFCHDIAKFW